MKVKNQFLIYNFKGDESKKRLNSCENLDFEDKTNNMY